MREDHTQSSRAQHRVRFLCRRSAAAWGAASCPHNRKMNAVSTPLVEISLLFRAPVLDTQNHAIICTSQARISNADVNSRKSQQQVIIWRGDGWSCDCYRYYLILQYLLRKNSYSTFQRRSQDFGKGGSFN